MLSGRGVDVDVVEYLKRPPAANEIRELLTMLGLPAKALLRKNEEAFRTSGLTPDSEPEDLIALMAREPVVIERPIVVVDGRARIGRPPENVLELIA